MFLWKAGIVLDFNDIPRLILPGDRRTDRAERLIKASPSTIYAALIEPGAVAAWLPPEGMKGQALAFEPWVGRFLPHGADLRGSG